MKLEKILVPLDGSVLAEAAMTEATSLAGKEGATIVLLRATEAYTVPGGDPIEAQIATVREAEDYLAATAARLREAGIANVETHVWYGRPAWAITEAARVQKIDLIVMSSHGRSGFGRLILGSVAESVLRGTKVPILLLRMPEAPIEAPSGAESGAEASHV